MLDNNKIKFLEYKNDVLSADVKRQLMLWFEKVVDYEKKIGKDVSCFEKEDVLIFFHDEIKTSSIKVLKRIKYYLSTYTIWMIENNNAPNHNVYDDINFKDLNSVLINDNKIDIISRYYLNELCDRIYNPRDRYFLLALYEGLRGHSYEEILSLEIEDVDFKEYKVFVKSRNSYIDISKKLAFAIFESYTENEYSANNGSLTPRALISSNDKVIYKENYNSKADSTTYNKSRAAYLTFMKVINSVTSVADINVTFIQESGIVDFIQRKAEEHNMTTNEYFNSQYCRSDIRNQYGINQFNRRIFYAKYEKYLK